MNANIETMNGALLESTYKQLSAAAANTPIADLVAKMLASQQVGVGDMPLYLGLSRRRFEGLFARLFPAEPFPEIPCDKMGDPERADEIDELVRLFLGHANPVSSMHEDCAMILATGSMGGNHLWQDLGFWSRADLSLFINTLFPSLAAKNVKDMKWKKFFYKQLCNQAGIYTCRAPSCEVCGDYDDCFGPED